MQRAADEGLTLVSAPGTKTGFKGVTHVANTRWPFRAQLKMGRAAAEALGNIIPT